MKIESGLAIVEVSNRFSINCPYNNKRKFKMESALLKEQDGKVFKKIVDYFVSEENDLDAMR